MSVKTKFMVTEKAGAYVAGVRSPGVGKPIELTQKQAQYALINGEIKPPEPKPAKSNATTAGKK